MDKAKEGDQEKGKAVVENPPDTDKGSDASWAELEAQKPPDIGKGEELVEEPGKEAEKETPGLDPDIAAIMQKKGFKSPKDLVAALGSLESQNTKQRQDLKRLEAISIVAPPVRVATPATPGPQRTRRTSLPEDPYDLVTSKDKFGKFITDFDQDVDDKIQEQLDARDVDRMRKSVLRKINDDPDEFMRLRPTMLEISTKRPDITDIEDLMSMAKSQDRERTNEGIARLKKDLGLEGIDLDRLKVLAAKANNPPVIAGTSGGGQEDIRTGKVGPEKAEEIIKKAILGSEQLEED